MKCPNCVFMEGYKKAHGMMVIMKRITKKGSGIPSKWVGWCPDCGRLVTVESGSDDQ